MGGEDKPQEQLLAPKKLMEYVVRVTEPGPNDHKLHRQIKQEYREFLFFYMKMGLRPGEAMNIKPEHVNINGKPPDVQVWRGKNNKWQLLGLPLDYLEPIRKRVEKGRWFNVNQTRLQIYMQRISKMAGRKVNLYSIRKSVDTFALIAGAPLMQLANHQGHTVATMQKYYTKLSAKQSSDVNNMFNPFINQSKLPIEYSIARLDATLKEIEKHPGITVKHGDGERIVKWKTP